MPDGPSQDANVPRPHGAAGRDDEPPAARGVGAEHDDDDDDFEWVDPEDEASLPAPPMTRAAPRLSARPAPAGDGALPLPPATAPGTSATTFDAGAGEGEAGELPVDMSDDLERAALLAAVLKDQRRRSLVWTIPERRRSAPLTRLGAGVLLVVAAWLWLLPPTGLQPRYPPPPSLERQEEGLRLGIYLQAQRIEVFRRRSGRLPDVLEETGDPLPGLSYRRMDARVYELRGVTPRTALTWVSTDSLHTLLGAAGGLVGR